VEEEKSTPSNPVYKPINLPDFQNGNVKPSLAASPISNALAAEFKSFAKDLHDIPRLLKEHQILFDLFAGWRKTRSA
jgi:hypothetical protein